MREAADIRRERQELRRRYGLAYQRLNDILFDEDPARINFEVNTDEYAPEVGTILPRLGDCSSKAEVEQVLQEEFSKWFGGSILVPTEKYQKMAQLVWDTVMPELAR